MRDEAADSSDLLSVAQVAALVGVTERYVRRLIVDGKLDGVRVGRQWMVPAEAAEARRPSGGAARVMDASASWALERDMLYAERASLQLQLAGERHVRLEERVAALERERDMLRRDLSVARAALAALVVDRQT